MNEFDDLVRQGRIERNKAAAYIAADEQLRLQKNTELARPVIEIARRVASAAINSNPKVPPDTQLIRQELSFQTPIGPAWTLLEPYCTKYNKVTHGAVLTIDGDLYLTGTTHSPSPNTTLVADYDSGTGRTESEVQIDFLAESRTQELLVNFVLKHELDVQLLGPS